MIYYFQPYSTIKSKIVKAQDDNSKGNDAAQHASFKIVFDNRFIYCECVPSSIPITSKINAAGTKHKAKNVEYLETGVDKRSDFKLNIYFKYSEPPSLLLISKHIFVNVVSDGTYTRPDNYIVDNNQILTIIGNGEFQSLNVYSLENITLIKRNLTELFTDTGLVGGDILQTIITKWLLIANKTRSLGNQK